MYSYPNLTSTGLQEFHELWPRVLAAYLPFLLMMYLTTLGLKPARKIWPAVIGLPLYAYYIGYIWAYSTGFFWSGDVLHTEDQLLNLLLVFTFIFLRARYDFRCT